ncbi:MAG: hypothetical protein MJ230_07625 [bacterium]|nr:hypothetical protein [bacterium]
MLIDFISIFLGAYNDLIPEYAYKEEYASILVIVVSALSIIMVTMFGVSIVRGVLSNFLRGFED